MTQYEFKLFALTQSTDIEKELNELGQSGWRPAHAMMTPFGPKFLLERQLDTEASPEDDKKRQMDELARKYGI